MCDVGGLEGVGVGAGWVQKTKWIPPIIEPAPYSAEDSPSMIARNMLRRRITGMSEYEDLFACLIEYQPGGIATPAMPLSLLSRLGIRGVFLSHAIPDTRVSCPEVANPG